MKKLISLLFAGLLLAGCSGDTNPYNPYASREGVDVSNKYEGDGNDFHIRGRNAVCSRYFPLRVTRRHLAGESAARLANLRAVSIGGVCNFCAH